MTFYFGHYGFCQTYNPSLNITSSDSSISSNGLVVYTTTNASPGDSRFTLFGDGYFSTLNNFNHQFPSDSNGFETITYFNQKYKKRLPTVKTRATGMTGNGSIINSRISMPGEANSKIGTSWSPSPRIENYFLLIFENTSQITESGCIEFYFNDAQLSLNSGGILDYSWVNNMTLSSVASTQGFNKKLKWDFNNLTPGEQRVVYIPMTSTVAAGTRLTLASRYMTGCTSSGSSGIVMASIMSSGTPHDPNVKFADISCIEYYDSEPHLITYTIRFQNEGDAPAQTVTIVDFLDDSRFDLGSLNFIDSEYTYTYTLDKNKLTIVFENIFLPGEKQTKPNTYTYEETKSFIQFSLQTSGNLGIGAIRNHADIIFDSQPAITTDVSEVLIVENCNNINEEELKITQTNDSFSSRISINPNPAENFLFIEGLTNEHVVVSVYNSQGELLILESMVNNERNSIKLIDLASGLYFVRIRNEFHTITKKILKI